MKPYISGLSQDGTLRVNKTIVELHNCMCDVLKGAGHRQKLKVSRLMLLLITLLHHIHTPCEALDGFVD